ncbi:hypothetical protein LTR10_023051 [Elasticomyces elasticus]|uniref:Cyclase n=1 Tax=Exophiala sideris TaxID=1016849 RepID=A0ABR0IV94_9EURO|nr:hypothetical protein LTR10_023051 [Elasticomyces elasticus]KAK5021026.1 hypothetical protein LTS07_011281 [Exophiala sideris]KAK5048752.1 hypothetical protein LTR69_011298 [Exophiala sideris]KAK5176183.1 hypothetical protein LTR44_011278 [Eurotiomycetes sp. CCFEE 6388]
MSTEPLPTFDQLPPVIGAPKGCAWGLFDKDGVKDQIGTLNLLTPDVVLAASREIITGESVALNWGLENPPSPFYREKFQHTIKDVGKEYGMPICCYDDIVTFNTQSSSQWDGFRHWGHAESRQHYNGVMHDDVLEGNDISMHQWSERGGIVGRGVLVDFVSWAERNGVEIRASTSQVISLDVIKRILREEGVVIKKGDILLLRTGLLQAYNMCFNDSERNKVMRSSDSIGAEASEAMVQWLWNNHFSAVAGDAAAFESQPFVKEYSLHDYLLVWWGMPIGEMWDLEGLAEKCKAHKRWTFFVTSAPLNVIGGVASPPNALAVF